MAKKVTLLGSTGSIGTQSLDVVRAQGYEVFGLSANRSTDLLLRQIAEFHPKYVCVTDPAAYAAVEAALAGTANAPRLLQGKEGLVTLAALEGADLVLDVHTSSQITSSLYCVRIHERCAGAMVPEAAALCPEVIWVLPDKPTYNAALTGALTLAGLAFYLAKAGRG